MALPILCGEFMAMSSAERSARYRAKDIEAYRHRKRVLAKKHKEKRTQYMRSYRAENRQKTNEQARESHARIRRNRTPEQRHNEHLKATYGITREKYIEMLSSQGGLCAICKSPTARWKKQFHVDHCHKSLNIRGLLCNRCNPMLGWFETYREEISAYLEGKFGPPDTMW